MKWRNIFKLPQILTEQDEAYQVLEIAVSEAESNNAILSKRIDDLEKELILYRGKMEMIEKYFSASPQKNEIEKESVDEIDLDGDLSSIPLVSGLKVRFEGEPDSSARAIDIQLGKPMDLIN